MGFVYEHISVEERAQIGLVAAAGRGSYGLDVWHGLCRVRMFSKKMWRGCRDRPGGSVAGPDAATVAAPQQGDPA